MVLHLLIEAIPWVGGYLSFPVSREGKNRWEGSETARGRGSQMRDGGAVGSMRDGCMAGWMRDGGGGRCATAAEGCATAATGCMTAVVGSMHNSAAA